MHGAAADFAGQRPNALDPEAWRDLANKCGAHFDEIDPGLACRVAEELAHIDANWPTALPHAVIHADLFTDNVLMLGNEGSGLMDCELRGTDMRAYERAVSQ